MRKVVAGGDTITQLSTLLQAFFRLAALAT
jgi:hypothetical protein